MPNQRRFFVVVLRNILALAALVGIILMSGCIRECLWTAKGIAWVDTNEDGVRDEGELPLCGVRFHVDDVWNHYDDVGRGGMSNLDGEASISVRLPGCPKVRFEVYVEVPPGYRLTTAKRLPANRTEPDQVFAFGLAPLTEEEGWHPNMPECTCYHPGEMDYHDIVDIASAPDGSVWVAVNMEGVARYSAERQEWTHYGTEDGLAHTRVRSITAAENGTVWFATEGGISRYDGQSWLSYTVTDGLPSDKVYRVVIGADGIVWSVTNKGAARLNPDTNTWFVENAPATGLTDSAVATPDGSLWLVVTDSDTTAHRISRLVSLGTDKSWITYGYNEGTPRMPYFPISDAAVAPDGSPWFGGERGLLSFSLQKQDWETRYWDYNIQALEIDADGSAWIVTEDCGFTVYHVALSVGENEQVMDRYSSCCNLPIQDCVRGNPRIRAFAVARDGTVWIGINNSVVRCVLDAQ